MVVVPEIFDNIHQHLLPTLEAMLAQAERADFCVGYFNLRGWKHLAKKIDHFPGGGGHQCRVLIGMNEPVEGDIIPLAKVMSGVHPSPFYE